HTLLPRPPVPHPPQGGGGPGRRPHAAHGSALPGVPLHPPRREAETRAAPGRQRGDGEHRVGSAVYAGDDVRDREETVRLGHLTAPAVPDSPVPNLDILSPVSSGLQHFRGWPGT